MKKFLTVCIVLAIFASSLGFASLAFAQEEEPPTPQPADESEFYRNFPGIMPGILRGFLNNLRRWLPDFLPGGFRDEFVAPPDFQEMDEWFGKEENWEPGIHINLLGSLRTYFLEALADKLGLSQDELQQSLAEGETPYEIAKSQGLTDEQIQELLREVMDEALKAAVSAGEINQEQASMIEKLLNFMGLRIWKSWGMDKTGEMDEMSEWKLDSFRGRRTPFETVGPYYEYRLQIYAKALGMSVEEIQIRLESGDTIAQVAQSQGLSLEEFRGKIVQSAKDVLDQAVQDGKLTQEQADRLLMMLERWEDAGADMLMRPREGWRMRPPERPFAPRGFWFRQP